MTFQVGDRVQITQATRGRYSLTTPGSYGVITNIRNSSLVDVHFEYLASGNHNLARFGPTFDIEIQYLKLHKDEADTVHETIRKLQRRQHFYQTIGKNLEAWKDLA